MSTNPNQAIVYIDSITNNLIFLTIPDSMFDSNSKTRQLMINNGITDLNNNSTSTDVLNYIQSKDVPNGVTSYIVPLSNFPTTANNRNSWTYNSTTNSVIGS